MKKLTSTVVVLAISLAVLVPAGMASATTMITSGVGEVNLGPIVIPNTARHWTVTWSYNASTDVGQSLGPPYIDAQLFSGDWMQSSKWG